MKGELNTTTQIREHSTSRHRLRDFGLYVLISLLVACPPLVALWIGLPWDLFMHWFGFVFFTFLIFGQLIAKSRFMWKEQSFWVLTSVLLAAHLAVFVDLSRTKYEISEVDWVFLVFVEMAAFIALRMWLYKIRTHRR